MKNDYKIKLMTRMLNHVPDFGWTWEALYKAALRPKKPKIQLKKNYKFFLTRKYQISLVPLMSN